MGTSAIAWASGRRRDAMTGAAFGLPIDVARAHAGEPGLRVRRVARSLDVW